MAIPARTFEWALLETDGDGNPLKSFPPQEIYQTGLLAGEPWARLWHNQMASNYSEWIQHLAGTSYDLDSGGSPVYNGGAEPVGTVKLINNTVTIDPTELWAGTWTLSGTQAMGAITCKVYLKTALT